VPFVAIPRCVKLEILYNWGTTGKVLANVLHAMPQAFNVDYTSDISAATCDNWMNSWASHMMPLLTGLLLMTAVRITDLGSVSGAQAQSDLAPVGGGDSSGALPPSVAAVLSLYTPLRSRSGRGRVFIAGVGQGNLLGDGTLRPSDAANMVAALNSFNADIGAVGATGFQLGVASKTLAVVTQVTNIESRTLLFRSQDRRELDH